MLLQYEIGIDASKLKRQLRGVEGDLVALQKRVNSASAIGARDVARKAQQISDRAPTSTNGLSGRASKKVRLQWSEQERMEIRAAQRAGNARIREIKREERERTRAFLTQQRQEEQAAAMQRRLASRQGALRSQWRQERQERWGNVARGAVGGVRNMVGIGTGALGLGGGYLAMNAVSKQMQSGAVYTELANKAFGIQGDTRSREQLRESIATQSSELGMKSGLGGRAVAQGLSNLTGVAGKTKVGQALLPMLVDLSDATGSNIEDVGKTGGQVIQAMNTRGYSDVEIIKQTGQVLAVMARQSQLGSIEFSSLAQNMGELIASTAGFEGNLGDLAETMGAISQLSISGGAGSAAEAMTAMMNFRNDIIGNAGRFESNGIKVFSDDSRTQVRDPMAVIRDVLTKTGGDLTKIDKLFNIRGARPLAAFQQASAEASKKAGGGKAGKAAGDAAVLALLKSITGAPMSSEEIKAGAEFRRKAPDRQFDIMSERFNHAVGSKLLPVVTDLIPKFEGLIPVAADVAVKGAALVSWMAADPWKGVGAAAALGIGNELMKSGIATTLKGPIGQVAGQFAALAAVYTAGVAIIDAFFGWIEGNDREKRKKEIEELNRVSQATADLDKSPGDSKARMVLGTRANHARKEAGELLSKSDSSFVGTPGMGGSVVTTGPSPEDKERAKRLLDEANILTTTLQNDAARAQLQAAKAIEDAGKAIKKAAEKPSNDARGKPMIARPSS